VAMKIVQNKNAKHAAPAVGLPIGSSEMVLGARPWPRDAPHHDSHCPGRRCRAGGCVEVEEQQRGVGCRVGSAVYVPACVKLWVK
jgi:hypothetical protein